jgi:P pilus assembly chaperone PapD
MLLCILFAVSAANAAFTIEPAQIVFLADRGEKVGFVEIVHVSGGPAAVQFSVYDRVLDIDGKLVSGGMAANSDFIVHPAQVILYPRERTSVQIQYRGKKKITEDRAYVLLSQEVPVEIDEDPTETNVAVEMLTNYYTVLALETNKASKLVFVSSKSIGNGKIEVIAENKGSGRVPMESISIVIGGKAVTTFTGRSNSIMPGTQRRFTFDYPRPVTAKEVQFGQ